MFRVDKIEVRGPIHGVEVQLVWGRYIARKCTQPKRPQNSDYYKDKMLLMQAQENRVALDEENLLFLASRQDNAIDEDVDEQPVQDLSLNVDNLFQADDCDAFDSVVDEAPTAQTMFMANLSSADPFYHEAGPSYDSVIQSEVHDHDHYQDAVCEDHEEHAMHDNVQLNYVVDLHTDYTSNSNMIPYDQDNAVPGVNSNVSSVPNDAYMMIYNDMYEPHAQSVSETSRNTVVENSLTVELATYKEQVELNIEKGTSFCKIATCFYNHNKLMVEEVTSLKRDFKQKENKYLEDFLDMKSLKEKVEDRLFKQDQSLQTVHMLCRPNPYYNELNKKQLTPEQIYWSQDLIKMKTEALKEKTTASRLIKALLVYPLNTPAMLIPRVLPTKSQVKIHIFTLIQLFSEFDKTCREIITSTGLTEGERVLNKPSNVISRRKHDEIERKNLLIGNDNLIAECLSKEVFYVATNSELNVARFTEMHVANTIVEAGCLELEAELSTLRDKSHNDNHNELVNRFSNLEVIQIVLWYLDSGCSKQMTWDRSRLINFVKKFIGTVIFRNDHFGAIMGYRDYVIGNNVISKVYYVKGLGHNLFSIRQFCDYDLEVAFRKHSCYVRDTDGVELIKGSRGSNLYTISVEDMMKSSLICFLSKASKNKSWLWHRRLNHLNFGTFNDLARKVLVRGLPRLKFKKDHLCCACQLGKCKKHTHKPKTKNTKLEVLNTLYMDLCGPMRVQTINGKKYILVIVDDYSWFTLVKFLRSKDETPETVPRTPQQNDVVERWNRTLIEAARTMLIFSKALMFLWAEAVATTCYTQNRSLIHTHHNKTLYELVHNKKPDLTFFRVFGALFYPKNDSEDLGKLQPTVAIEIFVGYAPSTKGPAPIFLTPEHISSGLVPNLVPAAPYVPPTNKDLEILFQPMFNEYLKPHRVERPVSPAPVVQVPVNSAGTPSSTTIDQDAPSLSISPSSSTLQSLSLHQGVTAESTLIEDNPIDLIDNNPFINIFALELSSDASSSGDVSSTESTYVSQTLDHLSK
nr:retrovirus-related Pol polyprotein from transposon TNT 1-94 [Tanacetum cinerariifolium]